MATTSIPESEHPLYQQLVDEFGILTDPPDLPEDHFYDYDGGNALQVGILLKRHIGSDTGFGTLTYRGGRKDKSLFVLVHHRHPLDYEGVDIYDADIVKTPECVQSEGHTAAYWRRDLDTALRIALDVLRGREDDYYPSIPRQRV